MLRVNQNEDAQCFVTSLLAVWLVNGGKQALCKCRKQGADEYPDATPRLQNIAPLHVGWASVELTVRAHALVLLSLKMA